MRNENAVSVAIGANSAQIYIAGCGTFTVQKNSANWDKVMEAIRDYDFELARDLLDVKKYLMNYVGADGVIKESESGEILVDHEPISAPVAQKVRDLVQAGHPIKPLAQFLLKLTRNPSYRAQTQTLHFMQANNFMIFENGNILGYKAVTESFKDLHTGTFSNTVGSHHRMARHKVNDDPQVTCSHGFHVAAYDYAKSFGGTRSRIMIVSVDPKDVVAVPMDYKDQKMRCCAYDVVAEIARSHGPIENPAGVVKLEELKGLGR